MSHTKNDKPESPVDHRPIWALPLLLKVYERVIVSQMTNLKETKFLYHEYQCGHRKNNSLNENWNLKDDYQRF